MNIKFGGSLMQPSLANNVVCQANTYTRDDHGTATQQVECRVGQIHGREHVNFLLDTVELPTLCSISHPRAIKYPVKCCRAGQH